MKIYAERNTATTERIQLSVVRQTKPKCSLSKKQNGNNLQCYRFISYERNEYIENKNNRTRNTWTGQLTDTQKQTN